MKKEIILKYLEMTEKNFYKIFGFDINDIDKSAEKYIALGLKSLLRKK